MKRITRKELTATIPFPEDKPWLRAAIASLYTHNGQTPPLHLLPKPKETP